MTVRLSRLVQLLMLGLVLFFAAARPAAAQSLLRDSETELLFKDISDPLIEAAGLDPKSVKVVLINDPEINAFVAQGQVVYIHSGLLTASDNVNQLQGVIAHELGHVAGGHAIRIYDGANKATAITILSLVLGAAAIAAGAGDAGMGIIAAGQQAAMGSFLAFTRAQESSADLAGATYLSGAGVSGKGSIEFFKKLQNQEYRLGDLCQGQLRPHPPAIERAHRLADRNLQEGSGLEPPDRSGARGAVRAGEGEADRLCDAQAGGQFLSGKRPERPRPLCPRLCLSPRRLSRESRAGGRRAARHRTRTIPSSWN